MTALLLHCPLGCNSTLETTDIILPEGALRRCTACAQLISSCSIETFEKTIQEWDNEDGTMPTGRDFTRHRKRITKLFKYLLQFTGKPVETMSLLDVGCSSGSSLQVALDFGFGMVQGVEPAQASAATAISSGFDVSVGFLEDARYEDSSFDVVLLFEVIEHLPEPLRLIKEIHRILKPGGILLLSTGNASSWTATVLGAQWTFFSIQEHGGHISFFSPQSTKKLAELTKFTLLDVQTRRMILTERAISTRLTYKPLKLTSELLSPFARMAGKGHQMYAYLRKV